MSRPKFDEAQTRKSLERRFPQQVADVAYNWEYIERRLDKTSGPDGCWSWHGAQHSQGYGMVGGYRLATYKPIMQTVHRLLMKIKLGGDIPEGKDIIHTCGKMDCHNPSHLVVGDAKLIWDNKKARGYQHQSRRIGFRATKPRNQKYRYGLENIRSVYKGLITVGEFAEAANIPDLARAQDIYNRIRTGKMFTWLSREE
jgi:hypothetical protein